MDREGSGGAGWDGGEQGLGSDCECGGAVDGERGCDDEVRVRAIVGDSEDDVRRGVGEHGAEVARGGDGDYGILDRAGVRDDNVVNISTAVCGAEGRDDADADIAGLVNGGREEREIIHAVGAEGGAGLCPCGAVIGGVFNNHFWRAAVGAVAGVEEGDSADAPAFSGVHGVRKRMAGAATFSAVLLITGASTDESIVKVPTDAIKSDVTRCVGALGGVFKIDRVRGSEGRSCGDEEKKKTQEGAHAESCGESQM